MTRAGSLVDYRIGYLRRHLVVAHNVPDSEALADATLAALDARHLREHFTAWRSAEGSAHWRELTPEAAQAVRED